MTFETTAAVIACTFIGLALLLYSVYKRNQVRDCRNWPQTIGTITKAEVIADTGPDSNGYFVSVFYDYLVNGASHQGNRLELSRRAYVRKKSAESVVERYRTNTSIPVFYNPEKPSDAVLVRESPNTLLPMVCGIGLLTLVLVILLFGRQPEH